MGKQLRTYPGVDEAAAKYGVHKSTIRSRMRHHDLTADQAGQMGQLVSVRELAEQHNLEVKKINYLIYSRGMNKIEAVKVLLDNNGETPALHRTLIEMIADAGLPAESIGSIRSIKFYSSLDNETAIKEYVRRKKERALKNKKKNKKKKK